MNIKNIVIVGLVLTTSAVIVGCGKKIATTSDDYETVSIDSDIIEAASDESIENLAVEKISMTEASVDTLSKEIVKQVSDSEEDLVAMLYKTCSDTLMVIIRDDFDDDGVYEAFAATSKDPNAVYYNDLENASDCYDDYTIWYVTHENASPIENVPFGPNFVSMNTGIFADGTKAVIVNSFMSNVDTESFIFILLGGSYKYLGTHTSSSIGEDGLLYSGHFIRDIDSNYFETEIYEYNNGELILKETKKEDD